MRRSATLKPQQRRARQMLEMMGGVHIETLKAREIWEIPTPKFGKITVTIFLVAKEIFTIFFHIENAEAGKKYFKTRFNPQTSEYNLHTREKTLFKIRIQIAKHLDRILENYE